MALDLDSGAIFAGDFRVVRRLAEGGMGAVFVVEQLSTGRQRALKVMHPLLIGDDKSVERFTLEARVGSRIESDHVVEVIGAGVEQRGYPWLAMELLAGETLRERVDRGGPLSVADAREALAQLGHALSRAHAAGLVHRDLKPENIFLAKPRRDGVPFTLKVLDFGIAKLVQETIGKSTSGTQSIGSPLWMAPEQANAQAVSAATDVWALGLVTFYALTGRSYWKAAGRDGGNMTNLLVELLMDPLEAASVRAAMVGAEAALPAGFDRWFASCVARDPDERFRDAGEATRAFVELLDVGLGATIAAPTPAPSSASAPVPSPASAPAPTKRRLHAAVWAGVALAILGVAGIVAAALFLGGETDDAPVATQAPSENEVVIPMEPLAPRAVVVVTGSDAGAPAAIVEIEPASPPPIARAPHARIFYDAVVRQCWQDSAPHEAERVRFELQLGSSGGVSNVRLPPRHQGTPFAACVVNGLPRVRFSEPPLRNVVVLNLPAVQP